MPEHEDDWVRDEFEGLRRTVEPTVDVEAGLDDLHGSVRRRGWLRGAAGGVAAVAATVALVAGSIAVLSENDPTHVVAEHGAPAEGSVDERDVICGPAEVVVHVDPGAVAVDLAAIARALRNLEGLRTSDTPDNGDRSSEIRKRFEDQPGTINEFDPDHLPQSVSVSLHRALDDGQLAELESIQGVLRVEQLDRTQCLEWYFHVPLSAESFMKALKTAELPGCCSHITSRGATFDLGDGHAASLSRSAIDENRPQDPRRGLDSSTVLRTPGGGSVVVGAMGKERVAVRFDCRGERIELVAPSELQDRLTALSDLVGPALGCQQAIGVSAPTECLGIAGDPAACPPGEGVGG